MNALDLRPLSLCQDLKSLFIHHNPFTNQLSSQSYHGQHIVKPVNLLHHLNINDIGIQY